MTITRQVAILLSDEHTEGDVCAFIDGEGTALGAHASAFDVYRDDETLAGHRGVAFSVNYRGDSAEEVDAEHLRIVRRLGEAFPPRAA